MVQVGKKRAIKFYEEKAKQAVEELKKVNKLPIETHITTFDLNIEQHGIVRELRCVD